MILCTQEFRERRCPQPSCRSELTSSTTFLQKLPKVFIFQIQRFMSRSNQEHKLEHNIKIPTTLQPCVGSPTYVLTGAVVHYGSQTVSGHFVSIIRCPVSGNLFICNDSKYPTLVEDENLLDSAYMLIFSLEKETLERIQISQKNLKVKTMDQSLKSNVDTLRPYLERIVNQVKRK